MQLDTIEIRTKNKVIPFTYRCDSDGDKGVMRQIFQSVDYNIEPWYQGKALINYHNRQSASRPSLIVDAGANIGASAVYFLNTFENSFVFSIEPEINNWQLLETNTRPYPQKYNFLGALSDREGELVLIDPGLSDWGFRTRGVSGDEAQPGQRVKCITPQDVLSNPLCNNANPLIFKIDIEGGESNLFNGDTSWMERFPLIIIELHDWMLPFSGSSRSFLQAVAKYDFDFVHRGENIFLFNRKILGPETTSK